MARYTVLESPDEKPDRVAVVPEGFAWGGLVFTFLWAAWHRMWVVAAVMFAAYAALTAAIGLKALDPGLGALIQLGIALIFGFEARQLQVMSLERSGFRRAGLIQASGPEAAELAYFAGKTPSPPPSAPSRYRAAAEDTLGIFGNV